MSIFDVTPDRLRSMALHAREDADEQDARADRVVGYARQAGEPTATTRETILRAVGASTATDWIHARGVSLDVTFDDGSELEVEGFTMGEALAALVDAVVATSKAEAIRLRGEADEMEAEAAEMAQGEAA